MAYEQSAYKRTMPKEKGFVPTRWAKGGIMNSPLNTGGKTKTQTLRFPLGGWNSRRGQEALTLQNWTFKTKKT